MTEEQARMLAASALSDAADQARAAARERWEDGSWAACLMDGWDFQFMGETFFKTFWAAIEAFQTLDPDKGQRDLEFAKEMHRQRQLATEEERRRRAEARKAKRKRLNPQVRNPLLPVPKVLPMVSSSRWKSQTGRTFRTGRTR